MNETRTLGVIDYYAGQDRYGISIPLLVGFITRVLFITVFFDWNGVASTSDDRLYVSIAKSLLSTGQLSTHHFPVGYPLFVAFVLKVSGGSLAAIRIAQIAISLSTVVTVSKISRMLYGRHAGLIAAWITALYPPLIFISGRIMSETLYIWVLFLSISHFLIADRVSAMRYRLTASALFGIASLVRSNLIPMYPLIPLWLFMRPGATLRSRATSIAVFAAIGGFVLMLPGVYFKFTQGEFIAFATNSGQTFYGANNQLADGGWVQTLDHPELLESISKDVRDSATEFNRAQFRLGINWIRENPKSFLQLLPLKFANAWLPGFQKSETVSKSRLATIVFALSWGVIVVGGIIGRFINPPSQRDGILIEVLVTYTLMSLVFYGNPRIGLFCSPVLIIYISSMFGALGLTGRRVDTVK